MVSAERLKPEQEAGSTAQRPVTVSAASIGVVVIAATEANTIGHNLGIHPSPFEARFARTSG
jgi:hypothetical protein